MRRHQLCVLEGAAIVEIGGDAGRTKTVTANTSLEAGVVSTATDHLIGVNAMNPVFGQAASLAGGGAEEGGLAGVADPGGVEIFIEEMFEHARELHAILRRNSDDDKIKDRITCLKYLEEVTKTYFILKKVATHDPDAAGSTVRKYATAFKSPAGIGKTSKRGRKPAVAHLSTAPLIESDDLGGDEPDAA